MASAGDSPRVTIASHYNLAPVLYNGLCWEAVQVLAEVSGGEIVAPPGGPRNVSHLASAGLARARGLPRPSGGLPPPNLSFLGNPTECDLFFYVAMLPEHLAPLRALRPWREGARKSAAFLFETWSSEIEARRVYYQLLDDFDHVFLFNETSVSNVQQATKAPCSYLPAATDCLSSVPTQTAVDRPIGIYSMGRTLEQVHDQLFALAKSGEMFYLWDGGARVTPDWGYGAARFRTKDLLRRSQMFLSFDLNLGAKAVDARGEQAIPARVFEGPPCGAVMLGTAPNSAAFRALFDWPDAIFEVPRDTLDVGQLYLKLSKDRDRVREASRRGIIESLRRHDWAHRWREILARLGFVEHPALHRRLIALEERAQMAADGFTADARSRLEGQDRHGGGPA